MNLEDNVSFVLRYGSVIGVIIVAIGLLAYIFEMIHSETVMTAGIAVIVFTPFAGMIVSLISLSANREKRYAISAATLIAITVAGMLIAFLIERM
ncbi:MAG: hypothetical protein FWG19_02205 [Methanomassiliicoccaceae archaeon]|nr:hypothetical protein [Methanomassiliicoccaceae archaeon]